MSYFWYGNEAKEQATKTENVKYEREREQKLKDLRRLLGCGHYFETNSTSLISPVFGDPIWPEEMQVRIIINNHNHIRNIYKKEIITVGTHSSMGRRETKYRFLIFQQHYQQYNIAALLY